MKKKTIGMLFCTLLILIPALTLAETMDNAKNKVATENIIQLRNNNRNDEANGNEKSAQHLPLTKEKQFDDNTLQHIASDLNQPANNVANLRSKGNFEEQTFSGANQSTGIVYTNALIHPLGRTIYITFLNTGTHNITLPNTAPWQIEKWLFEWKKVYVPTSIQVLVPIPPQQPGGSFVWSWDQKDNEGDPVFVGFFRVALSYYDGVPDGVPLETVYDYFLISTS
jgi:hypothetical protein